MEPTEAELREAYEQYRERQARRLVALLPREAVRPLYRAARANPELATEPDDPLGLLAAHCASFLPLPPFEVWRADFRAHPEAYLTELAAAADAPTPAAPVTLESRRLPRSDGAPWVARLRGFRDEDAWRGFIAFEDERSGDVHRTALIFREGDPTDLRDRFLGFESATLEAFLRSCRP
jgi:hypothetical protein